MPLDAEQCAERFFFNSKYAQKKRDILSEKQENGMALKSYLMPDSGNVDTYDRLYTWVSQ